MRLVARQFLQTFFLLLLFLSLPAVSMAVVTISSLQISNTNPPLGSSISVTFTYCDTLYYNSALFFGVINQAATVQACPAPGQVFTVDSNGTNQTDTAPGGGWNGGSGSSNGVTTCPTTRQVVWNTTIPIGLSSGTTYTFIVAGRTDYVGCTSLQIDSQMAVTFVTALPSPSCNATVATEATTVAPGGVYLVDVNYNFVNAGTSSVTYVLPPDVNFVSAGPNATYNGGSNSVSWSLGNISAPVTGVLWALVSVNPVLTSGTITNGAVYTSANCGTASTNIALVTVQIPPVTLTKSQSSSPLSSGAPITYILDWTMAGSNLQLFDSYSNEAALSNGSVTGYDGTGYTYTNPGSQGGFNVLTDPLGNNYLQGCAYSVCDSSTTVSNFPTLLRNSPAVPLCSNFTVEGNVEISPTANSGGDATMVIAENLAVGGVDDAYMLGISQDNGPGNLFLQKNSQSGGTGVSFPVALSNSSIFSNGTTITPGVWYTLKVMVNYNAGAVSFSAKVWPTGTSEPTTFSLFYNDTSPLPCTPGAGGTYKMGWQADGTASTDYFSDLKYFGPGPVVNASVTDIVPTGINYVGSGPSATGASTLVWNAPGAFPVTQFSSDTAVTWWGTVGCPAPSSIINTADFSADSGSITATSNPVTLTVTGSCVTDTPTDTPTVTSSPTITLSPTPTVTGTQTPIPTSTFTLTPTSTYTVTPTPTITNTPLPIPTATPTPIGLQVWPNPFNPKYAVPVNGVGVLKAYLVPSGGTMSLYTVSGELIAGPISPNDPTVPGMILWDGTNTQGVPVSAGIYYYVIQQGQSVLLRGKVLLLRNQ